MVRTGGELACTVARRIARAFTENALETFQEGEGDLYEKYNADEVGKKGSGGEYSVQTGFGWTNGVLVEFLCMYGDHLLEKDKKEKLASRVLVAPGFSKLRSFKEPVFSPVS